MVQFSDNNISDKNVVDDGSLNDSDNKSKKWPILVAILCFLLAIGLVVWSVFRVQTAQSEHAAFMSALNDKLVENTEKEKTLEDAQVRSVSDSDGVESVLSLAKVRGESLAEAETKYQQVDSVDISEYVNGTLRSYFAEDVSQVHFSWMSLLAKPYTWTLVPPMNVELSDVPCVWVCKVDNDIIGYVFGTYDSGNDVFKDIVCVRTDKVNDYALSEGVSFLSEESSDNVETPVENNAEPTNEGEISNER